VGAAVTRTSVVWAHGHTPWVPVLHQRLRDPGAKQAQGKPPGTLRLCSAREADEAVRFARAQAGSRADDVEWNILVQLVKVTGDRQAVAEELVKDPDDGLSVEEILQTPFLLFGTVDEIAAQILRNRERYGFTYYSVHAPFAEEFAPVIERLRVP
jgi:alkanesulfonate monooxygenase SsuD/methylene tetrahydromethanopterin reductase-like flavin-dependent oxidoreductase (luciferase family)